LLLNISETVWSTATKRCLRIDITEWQTLVVKDLWHSAWMRRGKRVKFMASY